ncbi:MAG: mitochondrial fission ELM1 family protein [Omnitrophica bacterium]|nr:mitochondrial fission ELM1 family protein [Candidatus Omnitrophota bacterium]
MMRYVDYMCAILVRGVSLVFFLLPTRFVLWMGARAGTLVYFFNTARRVIAYANLRAAFSREKTPDELRKLTKKVYRSLVQVFFEILTLRKVNRRYIDKYIDIVNPDNMLKIADHPKGIIFLSAHFGNWELSGMVSAANGFPLAVLAREQKMKKLNELINRLRESKGVEVVRKGITTRYIVKALHAGRIIGMVGDQDAGKSGELIEFFGRPVSTAPGTARIASKTGAYILPAFMARTNGPYHKLIIEEPIKIEKGEDLRAHLLRYNRLLEKNVRMYPDQWLWLHKRWKSTPLKQVTILTDGKTGHLNQAKAVSRLLKKYRQDAGFGAEDTKVRAVKIEFKNRFAKAAVSILSLFSGKACQGCMLCLRLCLTKECYDELMPIYSDIVIGCGSAAAGVNRIFSLENNAKSVHIMKPSILGVKKFDMVIIPEHDGIKGTGDGNIITVDTVPNLIDDAYLRESAEKMSRIARLEGKKRIGVLLGGNNSDFTLTKDITEKLLEAVICASEKLGADILFTTSRRTPGESEKIVKSKLSTTKQCKFLVVANEKNIPHAVGGILSLSDVIVVSNESSSMLSEAVSSGKAVVVFKLKKKKKSASKFELLLKNLENKHYIITARADDLSDAILRSFEAPLRRGTSCDRHNVYKYMWRLL